MTFTTALCSGLAPAACDTARLESARPLVRAIAASILGPTEDIEDVVQEVLIRAHARLGDLRSPAGFLPWIREVARTVTLNWRRRSLRAPMLFADPWTDGAAPGEIGERSAVEAAAVQADTRHRLRSLLAALPPIYAEPLDLFVLRGLSYEAIAQRLGLPVGTVKGRLHRARRLLLEGPSGAAVRALLDGAPALELGTAA